MNILLFFKKIPLPIYIFAALLIFLNALFFFISPEDIVKNVGIENSYIIVFLIAAVGGLNIFTSPILYATIATFAAGGSTPWVLGIIGGLGIALGDMIIFILLKRGYNAVENSLEKKFEKYRSFVEKVPLWVQFLVLYGILGFTPMPNDIIMALLVFFHFKTSRVIPLLILSGITIAMITAYTGGTLLETF